MNRKQSQQFNERKNMVLMMMANIQIDLNDEGSKIPIIQIKNILGIKHKTLYKCLHSLESDGLIVCTHKGYQVGKETKRWLITDKADEILGDEINIILYNNRTNDYYKSLNNKIKPLSFEGGNIGYNNNISYSNLESNTYSYPHYNHDCISTDYPPNFEKQNNSLSFEEGNIGYNVYLNNIITYINSLILENNRHSYIQTYSNLRVTTDAKKNITVTGGRVFNALCLTKSGKKIYGKSDKRTTRKDLLRANGYGDYLEVFDIKTQVPRLTYILQGGKYEDVPDFYKIPGLSRDLVKMMMLPAYFDRTLPLGQWHTLRMFLKGQKLYGYDPSLETYKEMRGLWYECFEKVWSHLRGFMRPIGPEIFLWSGLWEQLIIKEARERLGKVVLNVYDGFYYRDPTIEDDLKNIAVETSAKVGELYHKGIFHGKP